MNNIQPLSQFEQNQNQILKNADIKNDSNENSGQDDEENNNEEGEQNEDEQEENEQDEDNIVQRGEKEKGENDNENENENEDDYNANNETDTNKNNFNIEEYYPTISEHDQYSCAGCEHFYLNNIHNDTDLPNTLCEVCGNEINQTSLAFYRKKLNL